MNTCTCIILSVDSYDSHRKILTLVWFTFVVVLEFFAGAGGDLLHVLTCLSFAGVSVLELPGFTNWVILLCPVFEALFDFSRRGVFAGFDCDL